MATGGVGPDEAGQGGAVVMKKMVPVQSARPQPAASGAMAHQGEEQTDFCGFLIRFSSSLLFCANQTTESVAVAGDKGAAATPEQRAPPAVREDRRQPTAYNAPAPRHQPPPAEEEDDANDYDSDEASEWPMLISFCVQFHIFPTRYS